MADPLPRPVDPDLPTQLKAVRDRVEFEALIADLTSRFVNLPSDLIDGAIEDVQRRLVEALDIDRSTLFQFDADGEFVFTHYWSRPGFPPPPLPRQSAIVMFPWMAAQVRAGEIVCGRSAGCVHRRTLSAARRICRQTWSAPSAS